MGSINCKEYVTTAPNQNASATQTGSGTTGTYQSTCESNMNVSDYTEAVLVCNVTDLEENEMKQLDFIDNTKILMIKQKGVLSAIGNKCSHYGAPLHTGALGQGRVRCPWHGACFNIETGDIEDFPGLDSIPCYKVEVSLNGEVKVRAKRKDLESTRRQKDMVKRSPRDERVFVIVGGGPAGAVCAETLRQEGFTGRIVVLCREQNLPYDRVKVSKAMDISIDSIQFRNPEFYNEYNIEMELGVEATELKVENKTVVCSNGNRIVYDKIFIATGCRASKPEINGHMHSNVVTIRDHSEANAIYSLIKPEMNVVCLGSSFIALEAASYLANKVKSVSLIGRENVPLKASFGEQIGQRVLELFEENNVNMVMNSGIEDIIDNGTGTVVEVKLKDGTILPCDLLIMGTGSKFYTDFLKGSGIAMNQNGSIDTDIHLMTNIPDIYVGGDIANAPVFSIGNEKATIGHYQLAQYHGRIAAINMAGTQSANAGELHAVPFFFTMIFGKGFRYSGYGRYSDVLIEGNLADLKFVAYFLDTDNYVVAVASCGRDPIVAQFSELQSQGKRLHRCDIVDKKDPTEWTRMLKTPISPCKC